MIRIDNDYVIDIDANNYIPCVDLHKKVNNGKGKMIDGYMTIGFYNSLEGALQGLLDYKVKKSLSDGEKSLETAVGTLRGIYKEFEELVKTIKE